MKKYIGTLSLLFTLLACQPEGRVYVEHQKLSPDTEWLKKDQRKFIIPIIDAQQKYKMSLSFRYANGYQFQFAKIKLKEISPSGKEKSYNYSLRVREDNGDYIGEAGYDIWDSEHLVEATKEYAEVGDYTYVIEHEMPQDPLYFAMEIGILLDKK